MDNRSKEDRSRNMSRIPSKNTKPEETVRKYLFSQGFRYRKNVSKLPGKPDIVLPKYKTVIEVRGCYWHRHEGCKDAATPSSNTDFWQKKFSENIARDQRSEQALKALGWNVIVVWECEVENKKYEEFLTTLIKNGDADA